MFDDIDWSKGKNDENCISNAEKVNNYAMKFSKGHWTFVGPGSEDKWYVSSSYAQKKIGIPCPTKWYSDSKKLVTLCSKVTSAPFTHSVNQLRIYGAVAKWCQQVGLTEEEKERASLSVDTKLLTNFPLEEVHLLVSPPTMAPGNRMRENVLSFETLSSGIRFTQLCEKAYFQCRVTAGKKYKTRPDGNDGWETTAPLCREYTFPRSFPGVVAAIPGVRTNGPVLEV